MYTISYFRDKLDKSLIVESAYLPHPEDMIFKGSKEGLQGINSILETIKNPDKITIKFDGYPALLFGFGDDNKFRVMDKHMFGKKDGSGREIYSPQDFYQYDVNRKVKRPGLYTAIQRIWNGLQESCQGTTGYYWGDLLFSIPLREVKGYYRFKPDPKGITYYVECNSDVGKMIEGKTGGIAVHKHIHGNATDLNEATALQNGVGDLKNNSNVLIIPSNLPLQVNLTLNETQQSQVDNLRHTITEYSNTIDNFIKGSSSVSNIFTRYINNKVRSGNLSNLYNDFFNIKLNPNINDYCKTNNNVVKLLLQIWAEVYKLKTLVLTQLNTTNDHLPIKGYLDDNTPSQEGFVSQNVKFVDRLGFSKQLLSNQ